MEAGIFDRSIETLNHFQLTLLRDLSSQIF